MKKELDDKLCKDFPILYQDRRTGSWATNRMQDGFPRDGWYKDIRELSERLEAYNEDHPMEPIVAAQVKQKFGGMRFYVSGSIPPHLMQLITEYEIKMENICEHCGARYQNHSPMIAQLQPKKPFGQFFCDRCYK